MKAKSLVKKSKSVKVFKDSESTYVNVCIQCHGTGRHLPEQTCPTCKGTGK